MTFNDAAIFISYRRSDSQAWAGRLQKDLEQRFGRGRVFRDLSALNPGENFTTRIESVLDSSKIVIVVIGRDWASAADANGGRRLFDPQDLVRTEVSRALAREDVRVVPLLVDGAELPDRSILPPDLHELRQRNSAHVSDASWDEDVDKLVRGFGLPIDSIRRNRLIVGLSALTSGIAVFFGSQLARALFPIQGDPEKLTVVLNEVVTFAFPAAGLAAVTVYAHRTRWNTGRVIGLSALMCVILLGLTISFLWNAPFGVGGAYLVVLCGARGAIIGFSALFSTRSWASIIGAAAFGGLVGAVWGLVEPSVRVDQHSVLLVQRVIPLAAIGGVIGATITSAPRRR